MFYYWACLFYLIEILGFLRYVFLIENESLEDDKWTYSHHPSNSNPRRVKVSFTFLPFISFTFYFFNNP